MSILTIINPSYRSKKWWKERYQAEVEYSNHLLGLLLDVLDELAKERKKTSGSLPLA